ncbi:MAG: hypothetical protein WC873_01740 [Candidatus Gracilibacteria bacterium]
MKYQSLDFYPYREEKIPEGFVYSSANKPLVDFFNHSAKKCNQQLVSKIFVIKNEEKMMIGYVALGLKAMRRKNLKSSKSRGLYDRPAIVIGQLLIDERYRSKGCGKIVLKFVVAVVRLLKAYLPLRLLVVEALHDESKKYFQEKWNFEPTPDDPYTLVFDLWQILKKP